MPTHTQAFVPDMEIIWKPLAGYEGLYTISNTGIVKTVQRLAVNVKGRLYTVKSKPMKVFIDRAGYPTVKLTKNRKYGTQFLHRLLAKTFIDNPLDKLFVNHKNGSKLDYSLENLEWVTKSENQLHALRTGLAKLPGSYDTKVVNLCHGNSFNSIKKAAKYYDIDYLKCKLMLRGKKPNYTCLRISA